MKNFQQCHENEGVIKQAKILVAESKCVCENKSREIIINFRFGGHMLHLSFSLATF